MKKTTFALKAASVLAAGAAALCFAVPLLLRLAFHIALRPSPDKAAASIGIIGGADGPTAIFIAGKWGSLALLPWLGCLLAVGAAGLWLLARRIGKKQG